MRKQMFVLKDSLFAVILTGACDLCACLAQPSLLGLLLATASFTVAQKSQTPEAQTAAAHNGKSAVPDNLV